MFIETTIAATRARLRELAGNERRVALVPTMGALHDGHLALVDVAAGNADIVVVSVFVNPLQFGPGEDLARYPRTPESDAALLADRGAAVLFAPAEAEMYGGSARVTVNPPDFANLYEGAIRPGHFAGVLTVVAKLFNIVQPSVAIFGRKDLQQLALIRALVDSLDFPVRIMAAETVRENDGLALSSRNRYLDSDARARANHLRAALVAAQVAFRGGAVEPGSIESAGRAVLAEDSEMKVDYFSVVREADFTTPVVAAPGDSVVAAVRLGGTRLIDNIQL